MEAPNNSLQFSPKGNVDIVLTHDMVIKADSETLMRTCTFFRGELEPRRHPLWNTSTRPSQLLWKVILRLPVVKEHDQWARNPDQNYGKFEVHPLSKTGQPLRDISAPPHREERNHKVFNAYAQVLGLIYSQPLKVPQQYSNEQSFLEQIREMAEIGEYMGCLSMLSVPLSHLLLEQGESLYKAIASNPAHWSELGVRLRSRTIVTDAIIHLTGQWENMSQPHRENLPDRIRKLVQDKVVQLEAKKRCVEVCIMNYAPRRMEHPHDGSSPSELSRQSYAAQITDWIALATLRQYVGASVCNKENRNGRDGGWEFYSRLYKGGDAYLTKADMTMFHRRFSMTPRGVKGLERTMDDLKEDISELVVPLFANHSIFDKSKSKVSYFMCTQVDDADIRTLWELGCESMVREQQSETVNGGSLAPNRAGAQRTGDVNRPELADAAPAKRART